MLIRFILIIPVMESISTNEVPPSMRRKSEGDMKMADSVVMFI